MPEAQSFSPKLIAHMGLSTCLTHVVICLVEDVIYGSVCSCALLRLKQAPENNIIVINYNQRVKERKKGGRRDDNDDN